MQKPQNFQKIDLETIKVGSVQCRIDITKEGFFIFGNYWSNALLFEMNWGDETYNIKICVVGEGVDGWYLHKNLPIPKGQMKTLSSFKDFLTINMIGIANQVNLMDVTPNMAGVTQIDVVEIKHTVASSSGPNLTYEVTENAGGVEDVWTCTCPAFQYSKATPQYCKHIAQLK